MPKPVIYRLGVVRWEVGLSFLSAFADSSLLGAEDCLLRQPGELGGGSGSVRWAPRFGRSRAYEPRFHQGMLLAIGDCLWSPLLSLKQPPSKAFSSSLSSQVILYFASLPLRVSCLKAILSLFSECRHFRIPCLLILLICSLPSGRNWSLPPHPNPQVIED